MRSLDETMETLRKIAAEQLGKLDIPLEEIVDACHERFKTFDWKSMPDSLFILKQVSKYIADLSELKETGGLKSRFGDDKTQVYLRLNSLFTNGVTKSNELFYNLVDAYMGFTDVRSKGFGAGMVESKWYDERWHWIASLSINGGKDALTYLAEELFEVENQQYLPDEEPNNDNHWYIAYQESVLEAIHLARTASPQQKSLKHTLLGGALEYESPYVRRLATVMLDNPVNTSKKHGIADHKILLMYRDERVTNEMKIYSNPVNIDKVPLIKHSN